MQKEISDKGFIKSLMSFDKDNIPPAIIKTLKSRKYLSSDDFNVASIRKVSAAAASFANFVISMVRYYDIRKSIASLGQACVKGDVERVLELINNKDCDIDESDPVR